MVNARNPRWLVMLFAGGLLAACGGESAPSPAVQHPPPDFATLTPEAERQPRERIWDGVVEAVDQATLSAQTAGRVLELPFDINDHVRAGDVVVRFTDVEQQAGLRSASAALNAAEAAWTEARADYERIREIHERGLIAKARLDQATARRDSTRAALESARAAVRAAREQVEYTVIRAPYTGILTERHVQVGETVNPGQPLVSGLSLDRLRIQVEIPQSDVAALREHGRAAVLLGERRIEAEQVIVFPYADPVTHTFRVRLEMPEVETGLHPGMTVKTAFVMGETDRLLIPASALVRRSEVTAVYTVKGNRVALRQVRLGHRFDDRYEVIAGLSAGETIAADPVAARLWLVEDKGRNNHE